MTELLPWRDSMILWDLPLPSPHGVHNVRIVRHPATRRYPQTFSDGACMVQGWRTGRRRPADVFGALLAQGFLNQAEQRRALVEFSKVSGCGWAGRMLAGLAAWEGES